MATERQGELFTAESALIKSSVAGAEWSLQAHQLLQWQKEVAAYQGPLFRDEESGGEQKELFSATNGSTSRTRINPLILQAQPLNFWRWPTSPHHGAALYFILDTGLVGSRPLLLYIGETSRADQRWKGEHDCKKYLAAYQEALVKAELNYQLSIRFWLDVPRELKARRQLEKILILRWLSPFNKENQQRWTTPFTVDPT